MLRLPSGTPWQIGDRVQIIPNHCCPVVNPADSLVVVRGGRALETWPVDARGKSR